jgi:cyclopropane fatty-acyl-phospholipid synthase-like methyltransferase
MIDSKEHAYRYNVSGKIHEKDLIYEFIKNHALFPTEKKALEYYFSDGNSSANKLEKILSTDLGLNLKIKKTCLEFASGYGCVTRHLLKKMSELDFVSSDIHPEANQFIEGQFGIRTIQSHKVPEEYVSESFDIIFALSFFSHMPKTTWTRWLKMLAGKCVKGGHLIFTTHGMDSWRMMGNPALDQDGFYFKANSEQTDIDVVEYGTTITSPFFVLNAINGIPNCKLKLLTTGHWWTHQDCYILEMT